ncbi:11459_t:CDS:2 [Funneliformis caledonium]|uniref:11459_t:CDS:1 n=1 Tax=Funneliformis caledonium TaxID=1117310 RepID=A0A9N9HYJ3_9GLOM|nr:11459_t:CDS:2 [Funneliformis caledonium]
MKELKFFKCPLVIGSNSNFGGGSSSGENGFNADNFGDGSSDGNGSDINDSNVDSDDAKNV